MNKPIFGLVVALFGAVLLPAPAFGDACKPPCANVEASVKPTSVIPNPEDAIVRGESFTGDITTLNLAGNQSQEIALNFGFQIGSHTYSSVFVNENGAISFGSAIPGIETPAGGMTFQSVDSLSELGVPVIAPFYADLASSPDQTSDHRGNVVVQYGMADPYANDGSYQASQFQNAVRITWFGLTNAGPTNTGDQVYAQLLLTGDDKGTSSFDFRYGPPDAPGQNGDGSIAGFSLGADAFQFTGPYVDGIPTYFEFDEGRFVGALASSAVPEPRTWLLIIFGFAMLGAALRRRQSLGNVLLPICPERTQAKEW